MRRQTVGALSGALLFLAACGDDSGGTAFAGDRPVPDAVPEQLEGAGPPETGLEDDPGPALEEQTLEVGAEVYYAGFRVEVEEGRVVVHQGADEWDDSEDGWDDGWDDWDRDGAVVEVDAVVENLRDADARFPVGDVDLQWAGGSSSLSEFIESDLVRTGANARITFEFPVDESFSFDDAILYAGSPADIQAVVPLSEPDATQPAAPIALATPPESGRDGPLEIEITEIRLYASDPWYTIVEQQPLDQPVVVFTVDVTRHDDGSYGANIFVDDFRLVLPDGTQIAPKSGEADGSLESSSSTNVIVTFVLDDTPFDPEELVKDEYALLATGTSVSWSGDPEARVPFELQVEQ